MSAPSSCSAIGALVACQARSTQAEAHIVAAIIVVTLVVTAIVVVSYIVCPMVVTPNIVATPCVIEPAQGSRLHQNTAWLMHKTVSKCHTADVTSVFKILQSKRPACMECNLIGVLMLQDNCEPL